MYILVHGAYHASWCWQPLIECLDEAGHKAIAPDLPGHGPNNGWIGDQTLENYVQKITDTLDQADEPVDLVGHSLSGSVVAAAGERRPDKIKRLIFLAAYIPADGESVGDMVRTDPQSHVRAEHYDIGGTDAIALKTGILKDAFYHDATDKQISWVEDRIQLQGTAPFRAPIVLTKENFGQIPKAAIVCTEDRAISHAHQKFMAERAGCDPLISLDAGHSPFATQPDNLKDVLIGL